MGGRRERRGREWGGAVYCVERKKRRWEKGRGKGEEWEKGEERERRKEKEEVEGQNQKWKERARRTLYLSQFYVIM